MYSPVTIVTRLYIKSRIKIIQKVMYNHPTIMGWLYISHVQVVISKLQQKLMYSPVTIVV